MVLAATIIHRVVSVKSTDFLQFSIISLLFLYMIEYETKRAFTNL